MKPGRFAKTLVGLMIMASGVVRAQVNTATVYGNITDGVQTTLDNYRSTLRYLNRAAFTAPLVVQVSGDEARPGTLGRNALYDPSVWNPDASLRKSFAITERVSLRLKGDFLNAFNHTNLGGLVSNVANASFGQLTAASARTMQIGARIQF